MNDKAYLNFIRRIPRNCRRSVFVDKNRINIEYVIRNDDEGDLIAVQQDFTCFFRSNEHSLFPRSRGTICDFCFRCHRCCCSNITTHRQ